MSKFIQGKFKHNKTRTPGSSLHHDCQLSMSLLCNVFASPLAESVLLMDLKGETEAKLGLDAICFVWARALWRRASTVLLVPSPQTGNVRSSHSHQRPWIKIPALFRQKCTYLTSSTFTVLRIFPIGSTQHRPCAKSEALQKDHTFTSIP